MLAIELAERAALPDFLIRLGIRRMLSQKLHALRADDCESEQESLKGWIETLRSSPVALTPDLANEQHYAVPPRLFELCLGRHLKYSSGLWPAGCASLDESEAHMLALTCERAELADGMTVLDLGCGWGSLSLWIAEHHPGCRVLAVSNSKQQRESILARLDERGLDNVEVVTADMNTFDPGRRFDRVFSIEMFEHMRNWDRLLARIADWLEPNGQLMLHFFCHEKYTYPYETEGEGNWMGRHFFSGGMMPSDDLLLHFQSDLFVEEKWRVSGLHYRRTCDAWLEKLDAAREEALSVLADAYGPSQAKLWLQRWRIFFMACSELFGYANGDAWWVSHARLSVRRERNR